MLFVYVYAEPQRGLYMSISIYMAHKLIITDDRCINDIMLYCQQHSIAVIQGRSYSDGRQQLCWQIYCEDTAKLSFLLLKFGASLTIS